MISEVLTMNENGIKELVFIVAGKQQLPVIEYAKSKGYKVITVDNNIRNPGHKLADISYNTDVYDKESLFDIVSKCKPNGIVNFVSAHGILESIFIKERFGFPTIKESAFQIVNDKSEFRNFLVNNGFSGPKVYEVDDGHGWENDVAYPVIIKPTQGAGSENVCKINDVNELKHELERVRALGITVIVEEFIEHDYRINGDCFVIDNEVKAIVVGDYYYSDKNKYVAYATSFPSLYDNKKIADLVSNFVKKVNYGTGALNFEVIVRDGQEHIIEVNPRHSGNYIFEILSWSSGIDVVALNVETSMGGFECAPSIPNDSFYAAAILCTESEGVINKINISNKIKHKIRKSVFFKEPGDRVNGFHTMHDRIGLLLMEFDNRKEMSETLENFESLYEVKLT